MNRNSVRDIYIMFEKEQKRKIRVEEKASGIAPEHTPYDDFRTDIIERFKERDAEDQLKDFKEKRGQRG